MQKRTLTVVIAGLMTYSSITSTPPPATDPTCTIDEQADADSPITYDAPHLLLEPDSEEAEHKVRIRRRLI